MKLKKIKAGKILKNDNFFPYLCLIPSLIGVLIFFIVPFMVVIYYSMVDNPINREFVFLDKIHVG